MLRWYVVTIAQLETARTANFDKEKKAILL
jgi:hypothetical protein